MTSNVIRLYFSETFMPKKKLIIRRKLLPPQRIEAVLQRERLLDLLKKNLNKELILICADAGYGKTTLLSQLCRQITDNYIFYTLEPSDNDLATFFAYIITGIQKKYPHFGKRAKSIVEKTRNPEILVGTLINELMEHVRETFYIIIDDYQFLQNNRMVNRALDYFVDHMPPHMHLLIASRLTPQLNLVNYLTKQKLFKIEKEQLQFTLEEIRLLLKNIYDLDISEVDINRIKEHSEGWITAIQLVLLRISTSGADRINQTLNSYVSSGKDIFDYFAHEVFETRLKDRQEFLIRTSFLENMTPEVCDELTGVRDSVKVLKKFEQENVFISRTGDDVYRYHSLFQNYIKDIAKKKYGQKKVKNIYSEIGQIFKKMRNFELAIDYYLRGGLYKQAINCFKKIAYEVMDAGGVNRIKNWLELFPDDYLNNDPWLLIMKSRVLRITHQFEETLVLTKRAIDIAKRKGDEKNLFSACYETALVYSWTGKFKESLKYLKKCSRMKCASQKDLLYIYSATGANYSSQGDFKKAELMDRKALKIMLRYNYTEEIPMVKGNIAVLSMIKGEFDKALKLLKQTIAPKDSLFSSFQHINVAGALINLGRFSEARQALRRAYKCSKQFANQRGHMYFVRALGVYYHALNDYKKAEKYFRIVIKKCVDTNEKFLENETKLKLMSVLYLSGNVFSARQCMRELFDQGKIDLNVRTHLGFITKGLIELCSKKYKAAEATLLKCLQLVENSSFKYNLVQSYYHLAYFYLVVKKEKKAEYHLEKALKLARDMKYDAMLIREIDRDKTLIQFAVRKGVLSKYVNSIITKIVEAKRIEIKCFGDLEVSIGSRLIPKKDWQTKKAQLIFVYLILTRAHSITKDKLIDRFYRQSSPEVAKNNIRSEMWRVNKALLWDKYILYDSGFYRVNNNLKLTIDVEHFEKLARDIIEIKKRPDAATIEKARSAIGLYRDDFLVSFRNPWCHEMRAYYQKLYLDILGIIGNNELKQGNIDKALSIFQKILIKNPIDETGNAGTIKCYLGLNQKSQAIEHYETLKQLLKTQLNTTPSKRIEEIINT